MLKFFLICALSAYVDLQQEYSKPYTPEILLEGIRINNVNDLPETVKEELEVRSNWDDMNFDKQVVFDQTVYKVISFGAEELGNGDTFVLGVFDTFGNFFGRCATAFNQICELKIED